MPLIEDSSIHTSAYRDLPLTQLHESPFDPRKRFEQATGKGRPKVERAEHRPLGGHGLSACLYIRQRPGLEFFLPGALVPAGE